MAAEPSEQVGWGPPPLPPEPVFDSTDVEDYLREETREFMRAIHGDRRGIGWAATLLRLGVYQTIAASTDQALQADREQCSFADGPVMEALRSKAFVLVSDVGRDRRWPGYASAASAHGVQSLLSVPLVSEEAASAAVNLYAPSPHAFTSDDLLSAAGYVRHVARALRVVVRIAGRAEAAVGPAVVRGSLVLVDLGADRPSLSASSEGASGRR